MSIQHENPYQSPAEVRGPRQQRVKSAADDFINIICLVVGTVVGGLVGNVVGTWVARLLGVIPGSAVEFSDVYSMKHTFGLALLIIGGLVGAWLGQFVRFALQTRDSE
jgi:uncharacterized membrane protein YeaQ/YmgE (transglycosylase-associated protein family)